MGGKRRRSDSSPEPEGKILMAVDFGTTYSGLAWAHTRKPTNQSTISVWPSISRSFGGESSPKVPTELAYDGGFKWGFEIPSSQARLTWFKLELDPSQQRETSLATRYPNPRAAPPRYDTSAEKVTTDYLTALRKHAEKFLRETLPGSAIVSTPIQYIITMPAIWSDVARAKMMKCAEKAGMGDANSLQTVSEPEAAAIYALDALRPHNIKAGQTIMLCDAGGGTVDLITYTVVKLKPKLTISEVSSGTGSCCGSSLLNRRFEEFLKKKLGGEDDFDDNVLEDAMQYFETKVKRRFCGTCGEEFLVPVPGMNNNALGIQRCKLTVSGSEVREIFEPVLNEVMKLVNDQIKASKKAISAIILVGGFGENMYICDQIKKELRTLSPDTEDLKPQEGWTAVVRGALMKGLSSLSPSFATVSIGERVARKHYGIAVMKEWSSEMGELHRRFYHAFTGHFKINVFQCFAIKGNKIEEKKPLRLKYQTVYLKSNGTPRTIQVTIKVCSDPFNRGPPTYPDQLGTRDLVEVIADVHRLPASSFLLKIGADSLWYYVVKFEIEITFYSAQTTYELIYDGHNYGAVSAEYV